MSKNDLRIDEKKWRRKRLFSKDRPNLIYRFITIILIFGTLVVLSWWFEIPPIYESIETFLS